MKSNNFAKGGYEEMKRTLGRYFPGAILLALVSILSPTTAYASVTAKVSNTTAQSITSGTFQVAAEGTPSGTVTGQLSLPSVDKTTGVLMYLVNFGSINSASETITPSPTTPSNKPYALDYCLISLGNYGVFSATPFRSCATGTLTSICSFSSVACTASIPLTPGASPGTAGQNVEVRMRSSITGGTAIAIDVSISSKQIRPPVTTTS